MGFVHQDWGEVRVLGHRMPAEQVAAKWDIGFASEDMRLYESMTLGWHMNFVQSIYPNWDAAYELSIPGSGFGRARRSGRSQAQAQMGVQPRRRYDCTIPANRGRRPRVHPIADRNGILARRRYRLHALGISGRFRNSVGRHYR